MTLNEIELDVYRRLDYADSPPTSVKNRIDNFINQRHRQLLATDRMRLLRLATTTLVTVPGVASYGLSAGCARVIRIMDQANQMRLGTRTADWGRTVAPNPAMVPGTPEVWAPMGVSSCFQRPIGVAGRGLQIAGTVSEGTTQFTVTAVLLGGETYSQALQIVPGTPTMMVPMDPRVFTLGAADVTEFSASAPVVGRVTLYDSLGAGGTPIAEIPPGRAVARYYRIGLFPVPNAPLTYWIDFEREIPPLTDPTDEPLLPLDFHDIIALLARLDEYEFKSDDRWMVTKTLVEQRTRELRAWVDNHDAYQIDAIPSGPSTSRLGPFFPAGT